MIGIFQRRPTIPRESAWSLTTNRSRGQNRFSDHPLKWRRDDSLRYRDNPASRRTARSSIRRSLTGRVNL